MAEWVLGGIVVVLLGILLYWQLAVAEGAYLGRRVVALLYDWFAPRYDKVKQFEPVMDTVMLAVPIMKHLIRQADRTQPGDDPSSAVRRPSSILDVATGTGRLPRTLLAQRSFRGHIVALDLSARMLARAQTNLAEHDGRVTWLRHDAQQLPFEDNHFDVVTCLEALEFFPRPQEAIREMARVLKPGGLLVLSNRVGPDAWKLPGRAVPTATFISHLEQMGLRDVQVDRWLIDYDLVRAIK
jgi:ubiquinone/menaquinone biosynthesis C-methylase UbiE